MNSFVSKLLMTKNLTILAKLSKNEKLSHDLSTAGLPYCLALVSKLYLSLNQTCPTIIIKLKLPYR